MKARLKRVGDSFTVTVPAALVKRTGLAEGDEVEVSTRRHRLVIEASDPTLEDLLARIDGPPPPGEWDDIEPRGSDVW